MGVARGVARWLVAGVLYLAASGPAFAAVPAAPGPGDPFAAMDAEQPAHEIQAPGFRLQTFEGNPLALEKLRGKMVAFYFWRTW